MRTLCSYEKNSDYCLGRDISLFWFLDPLGEPEAGFASGRTALPRRGGCADGT